jgi:hypothetical protein
LQGAVTPITSIKENETTKINPNNTNGSPKGKIDGNMQRQECNGIAGGTEVEQAIVEGESNGETVANH